MALEAMRGDIELMIREEYEHKWQQAMHVQEEQLKAFDQNRLQIVSRLSPSKRAPSGTKIDDDVKDEIEEAVEELMQRSSGLVGGAAGGVGDSNGSSGNFSSLFDGQSLTPEEQALLKELKQREKESKNDDHIIGSPVDFMDMDDDDEEDDEDDEENKAYFQHEIVTQKRDAEIQHVLPIHQQVMPDDEEDDDDVKQL